MWQHWIKLDSQVTKRVEHISRSRQQWMSAITHLGEPEILLPLLLVVGVWQLLWGSDRVAAVLFLAIVAAFGNLGLSTLIRRPRPDTSYAHHLWVKTYSFPSEHAFTSIVVWGLGVYWLTQTLSLLVWLPLAVLAGCGIVAIGVSRVALGAHYVLDVCSGWLLGGAVLALLITLLEAWH